MALDEPSLTSAHDPRAAGAIPEMPMSIDACMAQHIGDREEQQDRAGLHQHPRQKKLVLAVVADGVGGHTGGALAAGQVVLTAKNNFEQFSAEDQTPEQL